MPQAGTAEPAVAKSKQSTSAQQLQNQRGETTESLAPVSQADPPGTAAHLSSCASL
jgi:hypothetical protein